MQGSELLQGDLTGADLLPQPDPVAVDRLVSRADDDHAGDTLGRCE